MFLRCFQHRTQFVKLFVAPDEVINIELRMISSILDGDAILLEKFEPDVDEGATPPSGCQAKIFNFFVELCRFLLGSSFCAYKKIMKLNRIAVYK